MYHTPGTLQSQLSCWWRVVSARNEGPSRTFRFAGVMGNPKLIALGHEFDERP